MTDDLDDAQLATACRAALAQVRGEADRLQIDIPWSESESWPPEVVTAAQVFAPRRREYELSGWVTPVSDHQWEAYVLLAPYASTSDVWTADMNLLAEVDDQGSVIFLYLPEAEVEGFCRALSPARVKTVPPRARRGRKQ